MKNTDYYTARAKQHLIGSVVLKKQVANDLLPIIVQAAYLIAETFSAGNKLLLCGNGGSAADCQHMAAEFVSRLSGSFERKGLPALSLTTDTSFLTAYSNDYNFDDVFKRQVETFGKPGDLLLGISTSGHSTNILNAFTSGKKRA